MTPEALRAFCRRRPAGAGHLQLGVDTALGVSGISEWQREEVESSLDPEAGKPEITATILESAQDFCDSAGEPTKFVLRWLGTNDRPLASKGHRCVPNAESEREPERTHGDPIVRELLGHIATQQKTINAGFAAHTQGMERALTMISALLEASLKRERDAALERSPVQLTAPPREATPEEREESLQRAAALAAVTGKLPELIDLGISIAAEKLLATQKPGVQ